jgi:hypothetical protein
VSRSQAIIVRAVGFQSDMAKRELWQVEEAGYCYERLHRCPPESVKFELRQTTRSSLVVGDADRKVRRHRGQHMVPSGAELEAGPSVSTVLESQASSHHGLSKGPCSASCPKVAHQTFPRLGHDMQVRRPHCERGQGSLTINLKRLGKDSELTLLSTSLRTEAIQVSQTPRDKASSLRAL